MSFSTFPGLNDLATPESQKALLVWLSEVFKALNIGVSGTYNFDATSGKVSQMRIANGVVTQITLAP